jgi:hypothetical protein
MCALYAPHAVRINLLRESVDATTYPSNMKLVPTNRAKNKAKVPIFYTRKPAIVKSPLSTRGREAPPPRARDLDTRPWRKRTGLAQTPTSHAQLEQEHR